MMLEGQQLSSDINAFYFAAYPSLVYINVTECSTPFHFFRYLYSVLSIHRNKKLIHLKIKGIIYTKQIAVVSM